jgi:eukaryotic-like serine/threonine-protein kinase
MAPLPESFPETLDEQQLAAASSVVRHQKSDEAQHAALAQLLQKMADQWRSGKVVKAEQLLADFPQISADQEAAVRVIYEEFCLREERGETPDTTEFYGRFPQWHDALAVVLECHHLLRGEPEPPRFPAAGQSLGELQLISELGRGALGRVFLASQPTLSDRLLAVKVTARTGQEHLSLARLQHTHIVPLYSIQDFPESNLRAMCMPYLGGSTWSAVLQALHTQPMHRRSGQKIVNHLVQTRPAGAPELVGVGPALSFLGRSTYVEAVCWIGSCLADALNYAHQRGLVHLDIKPSNVLLTADGQPMLLDFHIACEIERLEDQTVDRLGGTRGYMSPEQSAAAEAFKRGAPIPKTLNGRSDIYSLGVLLFESLAGELPTGDPVRWRGRLRQSNPQVSRGLEDIVCKCLAPAAKDRYRDAGQLAADLRLHLASLPLRGVPNRSPIERLKKWRRRKPYAMWILAAAALAGITIVSVGTLNYGQQIQLANTTLAQSQHELDLNDFAAAKDHAQLVLDALTWIPWRTDLKNRAKQQLVAVQRAKAVAELHELVEKLRFYDYQPLGDRKLAELAPGCRDLWQLRSALLGGETFTATDGKRDARAEQLRQDLLDLAILSARLDVHLAPQEKIDQARRQAIERLDEARETCGDSPVLELARRDYDLGEQPNGEVSIDSLPPAKTAWEHYVVGRWLMHHHALTDAHSHFEAALNRAPGNFWAYFQLARADFELGRFDDALTSAKICLALEPRAESYYNRAVCYEAMGHTEEALNDFNEALKLDRTLAPALFARGTLRARMEHYPEAKTDLEAALVCGSPASEVCYQMALLNLAQHNSAAANDWLRKALLEDPSNAAATTLQSKMSAASR